MFQRAHLQQLIKRMNEPRKFIQVLTGPRQVGKTTLVGQLVGELSYPYLIVSADAVALSNGSWLQQQWNTAQLQMDQSGADKFLLVIDEIQKIEQWSETVKLMWDSDTRHNRNMQVILLGSSRLLLQKGLTESLAGRFETTYMGHWSFAEMQAAFNWNMQQYIWFGGYPGAATLIDEEERWKDYVMNALVETSISKDILMLTRVEKPALMKRLFELGSLYSGQILSYTKMIGQLQEAGNTTTLSHYLDLLNTAGLLGGIEKYAGDIIRKRSSSPKFQVHNTAFISAQSNQTLEQIIKAPAEWGRMVESAVGAHLLNMAQSGAFNLFYWRERNEEVDFVVERRGKLVAIEVKSGAKSQVKGMEPFNQQYHPQKLLLVGEGGMPIEVFLKMNLKELF